MSEVRTPSPPSHILIVEDEPLLLDSLALALGRGGNLRVSRALSGEEALACVQREPPDLLVTDIKMPGMGGLGLLEAVRQRFPKIPVVVMSAYGTDSRKQALRKGAAAFLEKPFRVPELRGLLQSLLIKRGSILPAAGDASFEGRLESLGIQDVIQVTCLTRSHAKIEVQAEGERGWIWITERNAVHAVWLGFEGIDAVRGMLGLNRGRFRVLDAAPPDRQTIHLPWTELLMECVRLQDEGAPLSCVTSRSAGASVVPTAASISPSIPSLPSEAPASAPLLDFPEDPGEEVEASGGGSAPPASPSAAGVRRVERGDAREWLGQVSHAAGRFLGKSVIANYWRDAQPQGLSRFRVQRGGEFEIDEAREELSGGELLELQVWVDKFLQRGERIVIDLRAEVCRSLQEDARALLGLEDAVGKERESA
jgi:CheY-like chemotaxis protein